MDTPTTTFLTGPAVEVLTDEESWALLRGEGFGRLVLTVGATTDVWPVDFAVDGPALVVRTAEGTKLLEALIAGRGLLEADHRDERAGTAWSVVVRGPVEVLDDDPDHRDALEAARALDLRPWAGGPRDRYVRLTVEEVSGRRFRRATGT